MLAMLPVWPVLEKTPVACSSSGAQYRAKLLNRGDRDRKWNQKMPYSLGIHVSAFVNTLCSVRAQHTFHDVKTIATILLNMSRTVIELCQYTAELACRL